MIKEKVRELIHATPFVPFYIHTANGKSVFVHHPDFIFAAPSGGPDIVVEEANGRWHLINVMLITSLEKAPPPQDAAR
jgi:hypothetical protein